MKKRKTYKEEAPKLAKAFEIAIEAYTKHPPVDFGTDKFLEEYIPFLDGWMQACLSPKPPFKKTITSLKFLHPMLFEYFQEHKGTTVEYFWLRMKEEQLDYQRRKEPLHRIILKRGKIKDRNEYNYVVDMILDLDTSPEETIRLDEMIGAFRD